MALITKTYTFTSGSVISASEHNTNFDTVYDLVNGNITNANIKSDAAIADTKLAAITTAGKVSGAALTSLSSTPSGAGNIPAANLGVAGTIAGAKTFSGAITLSSTLNLGSTNQGDILYDNGTSIVRLTPGTAGHFLKTGGAGANPSWTSSLFSLNETKTISGAATTGNFTIVSNKKYLLIFNLKNDAATTSDIAFKVNADGDSNHVFARKEITFADPPVESTDGSAGAIDIDLDTIAVTGNNPGSLTGSIFIDTTDFGNEEDLAINGHLTNSNLPAAIEVHGRWQKNETVASFAILSTDSKSFSGTFTLYELTVA